MAPALSVPIASARLAGRVAVSVRNTFVHADILDACTPKEELKQQRCMRRSKTVPVSWPSEAEDSEIEEVGEEDTATDLDDIGSSESDSQPLIQRLKTLNPWDGPFEDELAPSSDRMDDGASALDYPTDRLAFEGLADATGAAYDAGVWHAVTFEEANGSIGRPLLGHSLAGGAFESLAVWDWACYDAKADAYAPCFADPLGGLPGFGDQRQVFKPDGQFLADHSEVHFQAVGHENQSQAYNMRSQYETMAAAAPLRPNLAIAPGGADTANSTATSCEATSVDSESGSDAPVMPSQDQCAGQRRRSANATPCAEAGRTTVMLRNLPNNYSQVMLLELIDAEGFAGSYDFLYLPIDFRTHAALGYAFINLVSPGEAERLKDHFHGFWRWSLPSSKVCTAAWSHPHQGLDAHIARYRNSPLMHESVPDSYRPSLFQEGSRVVFPAPTKKVKPPRQGTERMLV